jgi:CheY-like chemotaxis protein
VLHELATNARKYGALASPAGHLAVRWQLAYGPTPELRLQWTETGVPGLRAPSTRGFGTTLIESSLRSNGGEAILNFDSGGVVCGIRLPLPDHPTAAVEVPPAPGGGAGLPASAASLRGKRILVIEDEPLVALEIEAVIRDAGGVVIGPAANLALARRLIDEERFDAALLDANLGGEPVDALAAALTRKGVRFAFATGYGRTALPLSFRAAPLIGKPFDAGQLVEAVARLLADGRSRSADKA